MDFAQTWKRSQDEFKQVYKDGFDFKTGDACDRCKRGMLSWHRRRTAGGETMLTLACSHCPAVYERVPDER